MVLGNPYDFSIDLDIADKWNSKDSYSFYNGILASGLEYGLEDNIEITEAYISMNDMDEIISKLKE